MAHEIQTHYKTGRTLTFALVAGITVAATGVAMAESAIAGRYTGTPPGGTAAATYAVLVYDGADLVHAGTLIWTGTAEGAGGGGSSGDPLLSETSGYAAGTAGAALDRLNAVPSEGPVVVVPGAPAEVGVCRVYGYLETPDNKPAAKVEVVFELVPAGGTGALSVGPLVWGRKTSVFTNPAGALSDGTNPWVELQRNDLATPAGSKYIVRCDKLGITGVEVTLDASTANLTELLVPPP